MKTKPLATPFLFFLTAGIASAANIVAIDFDANPSSYTYGFNSYFGYGSANSGGNQAETAWNVPNRTAAISSTTPAVTAGVGVGGSSGLTASFNSSGLTAAANQDALERFGDATVGYTYLGGSIGTGRGPAAQITTTDLSQITFSIEAAFQGVASAGDFLRVDISFNPGMADVLTYRAQFALPNSAGFNTFTGNFASFNRTLGTDNMIDDVYNNINFNIELVNAHDRFGIDSGNSITMDNLMITQVPEPTATLLAALGLLSFSLARRR